MQGKESYRKVCEDRKVSAFHRRLGSSSVTRSRPTAGAKLVKQESKWYLAQKQAHVSLRWLLLLRRPSDYTKFW